MKRQFPPFLLPIALVLLSAIPASSATVMRVVGGNNHTCSLTTTGAVQCWGLNTSGQLGDATTTNHPSPVTVSGLGSGVTAISAGSDHTCAVTSAGAVKCWGINTRGQLGDGTTDLKTSPTQVSGLTSGVVAVSAGGSHTCALTSGGAVKCWGYNSSGQLGDSSTTQRLVPVPVTGLASGVTGISAGSSHTCAIVGGSVQCWGGNSWGQLGDGTTTNRSAPWTVSGLWGGIIGVASGYAHTCAITSAATMTCWGSNFLGELGDGTTVNKSTPVAVVNLEGVVEAYAGLETTCAVTNGGAVYCWGTNGNGQLGNGSTGARNAPTPVNKLTKGAVSAAVGYQHACAVTVGGGVLCWGYNGYGQLGDNSTIDRQVAVSVSGLAGRLTTRAAMLASGSASHACVLGTGGGVKCWGYNYYGQLGDNTTTSKTTPVTVYNFGGGGATALAVGGYHTCAASGGNVYCSGYNYYGQLGDGTTTNRSYPASVSSFGTVTALSAGDYHTCALTSLGAVYCWGYNGYGQLGDNTTTNRYTPAVVSGLTSGVAAIASGADHNCALKTNGTVVCWGNNTNGSLGDGSTTQRTIPVAVSGITGGIAAIAAGENHSCALSTAGGLSCWGYNSSGQLGDNTTTQRLTPVPVSGASSGIAAVTAGDMHTCAVTTAGGAKCWGSNASGRLGDGTTTNRSAPVSVGGLSTGVAGISASGSHTCALTMSGGVRCWGYNGTGQLGDGTNATRSLPGCVSGQEARAVPGDYDGDALSDTVVYRGATAGGVADWWGLASSKNYAWQNGYLHAVWGSVGQSPVPGDYDGDGRLDPAVYTAANGDWWILKSTKGYAGYQSVTWGGVAGDVPVPADYDGDGRTDIGVFRPSSGDWWILLSTYDYDWQKGYIHAMWGTTGDIPVPADYDGDGKADLVVFRGGDWWGLYSSNNYQWTTSYLHVAWGAAGDYPVPGDYDGDGKADIGVFRQSSGEWWVVRAAANYQWQAGYIRVVWGGAGQVPMLGDFDGDSKADLTVYTTASGAWWGVQSANNYNWQAGYLNVNWGGAATDVPVPPPLK